MVCGVVRGVFGVVVWCEVCVVWLVVVGFVVHCLGGGGGGVLSYDFSEPKEQNLQYFQPGRLTSMCLTQEIFA